jgi:hypothetical protein
MFIPKNPDPPVINTFIGSPYENPFKKVTSCNYFSMLVPGPGIENSIKCSDPRLGRKNAGLMYAKLIRFSPSWFPLK